MAQRFKQFRIFLIKNNRKHDSDIIKDIEKLEKFVLKDTPFEGVLYVKRPYRNPPIWVSYLESHIDGQLEKMFNSSTSSVLLVRKNKRIFAFVFGHGRHLLNPSSFERDFGLKVVLNRIDPYSIRSIDHRHFDELTLQSRQQTSKGSSLDSFNINIDQNLLRQAAGVPDKKYTKFGTRIAGSDSLLLVRDIDVQDLAENCAEWLRAYEDIEYKTWFSFIDHMRVIRDPQQTEKLNGSLLEDIANRNFVKMHMAPPEPIDWEYTDGFSYNDRKDIELDQDLDIERFVNTVKEDATLSVKYLKSRRVFVKSANSEHLEGRWPAYDCIVYELEQGQDYYVFTCGQWFSVNHNFVDSVNTKVSSLAATTPVLPAALENEQEGDYNVRIGKSKKYAIVDKNCARIGGSPVEPCDLFTNSKQFIHIKRKTRSATLSHLFAQGSVSAECFIRDPDFRKNLIEILENSNQSALSKLIPGDKPNPTEFEIVYGIVAKEQSNWPLSLPFFSRLTLKTTAEHLESMSFKVSLIHIIQQ